MNLRNWTKYHTYGLLLGIATTVVAIPLAIFLYGLIYNYSFDQLWYKFTLIRSEKSKMIAFASIANLIWFHTYIKRENWGMAMGVILATVINLFFILYFKYLA